MELDDFKDKGLAGFVKQLGKEMQSELSTEVESIKVSACSINENDQEHQLYWRHDSTAVGNITLKRNSYNAQDINIIGSVGGVERKSVQHYPDLLRSAANAYASVLTFLKEKFNEPVLDHPYEIHYKGKIPEEFL